MDLTAGQSVTPLRDELDALLRRALRLDLEVSHQGKLLKLGALLGDSTLTYSASHSGPGFLDELNRLAEGAACLLGHNLLRHDLPILRESAPGLALHRLPVIDSLALSPICFPENPYHRLVKDYKLVRESVNDPVADARQAGVLFRDEFRALAGCNEQNRAFSNCFTFCFRQQRALGMAVRQEWRCSLKFWAEPSQASPRH